MEKTRKELETELEELSIREWRARDTVEFCRSTVVSFEYKLKELEELISGIWFHHLDGSDLMVNKSELFHITVNEFENLVKRLKWSINTAKKRIVELKKRDPEEKQIK